MCAAFLEGWPAVTAALPTTEAPEAPRVASWRRPPRWLFHASLAVMLLVLLWSESFPGLDIAAFCVAVLTILALGLAWGVRLIGWASSTPRPPGRLWFVAPAMGVLTLILVITAVPLRARFEFARSDFDAFVAHLESQGNFEEWVLIDAPKDLGSYEIRSAYQLART
jgi:hypothetical protein